MNDATRNELIDQTADQIRKMLFECFDDIEASAALSDKNQAKASISVKFHFSMVPEAEITISHSRITKFSESIQVEKQ
jgi:hypothetical protein